MSDYIQDAIIFDCEVYSNYFLASFMRVSDAKVVNIECAGEDSALSEADKKQLRDIMKSHLTVGFNSLNFDIPIISYALMGRTCSEIKELCDYIINTKNNAGCMTMRDKDIAQISHKRHIDLITVAPGVGVSLKMYGARMHCTTLQELPIDPSKVLNNDEMHAISVYCHNDLELTKNLFLALELQISLRRDMSAGYNIDLMSKSDAQIAESVIRKELADTGTQIGTLKQPVSVKYTPPDYIEFKSAELKSLMRKVVSLDYVIGHDTGKLHLPEELSKTPVRVGGREYKIGIGGLHSVEKCQSVDAPQFGVLAEVDVASYYPNMILNMAIEPKKLGGKFLQIYKKLVDERLAAKRAGDKSKSDSLKIVINGTFGKLGSKYSAMYDPKALLQVTLTGQLLLLMLIEDLDLWGVEVVSANTDGVVCRVTEDKLRDYKDICANWEKATDLVLEETRYRALYSRDVNNYLAVKEDGSYKGKGIFAETSLTKSPQDDVCTNAVIGNITDCVAIDDAIIGCDDVRQFLSVRQVKGGAEQDKKYLGKVVRWVYSKKGATINYVKNGNKVPKSDGSKPVMTIDDTLNWSDIDRQRYIDEAYEILQSVGYYDF